MMKFRDKFEEMEYEKYGVGYFFDVEEYLKREGGLDGLTFSDGGTLIANLAWLTFPQADLLISDLPNKQVRTTLSRSGFYTVVTEALVPDIREKREELAEYMRRGPVAFVNSMKSWPTSRTLRTYKHFGDAWFDTMMERAVLAAAYLGDESNPVKEPPKPKPKPSKVEGNVITVNFGGRK